jgi:hypothetical protein
VQSIRSRPRREICVTVEEEGVWIYANRDGLKALADRIGVLAQSDPADHYELHLRWHLGSHGRHPNPVFVLVDDKVRKAQSRARFEVTVMAVEPKDLRKLRRYEKLGRLPRDWRKEEPPDGATRPQNNKMQQTRHC